MALPAPRKKPFTEQERDILLAILKKYADIIENRRTDSITLLKKRRTWNKVTEEYNRCSLVTQKSTVKQLEKAWKNLKAKERTFRLSDYCPKTPLSDSPESEEEEDEITTFLNDYNASREARDAVMSSPVRNSLNVWNFEESISEGRKSNLSNGPAEGLLTHGSFIDGQFKEEIEKKESTFEVVHETPSSETERERITFSAVCSPVEAQSNPSDGAGECSEELQKPEISSLTCTLPASKTVSGEITILAVHPEASVGIESIAHQDVYAFSQDSSLSFRPKIPDNQNVDMQEVHKDDPLHDLKIQLASAQLAKVKAETELQTRLLKEQLRKAKAEADLAEFLLKKSLGECL